MSDETMCMSAFLTAFHHNDMNTAHHIITDLGPYTMAFYLAGLAETLIDVVAAHRDKTWDDVWVAMARHMAELESE